MSRLWHWLTCREPVCLFLFGAFQHPCQNRKLRN